ncbi:hypothetical protein CAPTEDRAFT_100858 [Capitella teleta]|uniref:Neurotransmitter-gated ion-channel ligand-binding domain-containing protein n=1 Tax=Capitella teleta TaxID=283909 RepID=R7VD48_CAPTE|nr:hypothetical protein CAPTEDRAFT_100858 [Capitella teleta]|eukprot:ELU14206.1 hypothetical protein CAPTEDRAFT_100858 [Capitella teleta]
MLPVIQNNVINTRLLICLLVCSALLIHTALAVNASEAEDATHLLNKLLDSYDKRFHPGYYMNSTGVTEVDVNLNIRSMGPISEMDMAYQMDCYFRQQWTDSRLRFDGNETLRVSVNILERLWKPDTHVFNGRQSYLHTVTTPNKLLRIDPDGSILYSMRLTIKASCPMHLENFPMDTQTCPLVFGSHGYGTTDVIYRWKYGVNKSIKMAPDMTLSQFDLIGIPSGKENKTLPMKGSFSALWANFELRRHMGYFLINVYIPCSLLVVISWVGFWINREATSDRIGLGITNVLTMAFLGIDNRRDIPKVSYSTALDYFVGTCFAFILATIIQFAAVHYFTKHGSGEIMPLDSDGEDDVVDHNVCEDGQVLPSMGGPANGNVVHQYNSLEEGSHFKEACCHKFYHCLIGNQKYRDLKIRRGPKSKGGRINSVSEVDMASRVLFPLAFAIFNVVYWVFYLDNRDVLI